MQLWAARKLHLRAAFTVKCHLERSRRRSRKIWLVNNQARYIRLRSSLRLLTSLSMTTGVIGKGRLTSIHNQRRAHQACGAYISPQTANNNIVAAGALLRDPRRLQYAAFFNVCPFHFVKILCTMYNYC